MNKSNNKRIFLSGMAVGLLCLFIFSETISLIISLLAHEWNLAFLHSVLIFWVGLNIVALRRVNSLFDLVERYSKLTDDMMRDNSQVMEIVHVKNQKIAELEEKLANRQKTKKSK